MAFGYRRWRDARLDELRKGSEVVESARGPIEVAKAGAAPYLLQLHGSPGGCDQGMLMGRPFADAGFGTLAVSRPGYLRSPLGNGTSAEAQADAFAALLDALSIDRVAVQGASGGGPSAIQFAARHPDRTLALLLTCAVSDSYPLHIPAWAKLFLSPSGARLTVWMFERFPRAAIKQTIQQESTNSPEDCAREADEIMRDPERLTWVKELMGGNTPWEDRSAGFYNDLDVIRRIASEPLPLEQVQCPTLIVHGTADNDVPYSNSQQAAKRIRNATLYTMEGAHHLLWLSDQAPAMIRTQTDFLKAQL